jgi:hypothetical protein
MTRVLKDADNLHWACIFTARTKALVNQVAGNIINFFGVNESIDMF